MAEKKERSNIPQEILDNYDKLMKNHPDIERKGATVPYTSFNGHMASYLDKNGSLALRMPKGIIEEFIEKYNTSLCQAYGIVQKEYAVVPDELLENTPELQPYFDASVAYVQSLKPKKK